MAGILMERRNRGLISQAHVPWALMHQMHGGFTTCTEMLVSGALIGMQKIIIRILLALIHKGLRMVASAYIAEEAV